MSRPRQTTATAVLVLVLTCWLDAEQNPGRPLEPRGTGFPTTQPPGRTILSEIDDLSQLLLDQLQKTGGLTLDQSLPGIAAIAGQLIRIPDAGLPTIEDSRLDEQLGADAGASGSTSLVRKAGAPAIGAVSLEHGTFTQRRAGTTLTAMITPAALGGGLGSGRFRDVLTGTTKTFFNRFAVSASSDTVKGDTTEAGGGPQTWFSQWSARMQIVNARSIQDPRLRWVFVDAPALDEEDLDKVRAQAISKLKGDLAFLDWWTKTASALTRASRTPAAVRHVLVERFQDLPIDRDDDDDPDEALADDTLSALRLSAEASTTLVDTFASSLANAARAPAATVEYVHNREPGTPSLSTVRLIATLGGHWEFTHNLAVTFFNEEPEPGESRFRNFDIAFQADTPFLRGSPKQFVLSHGISANVFRERRPTLTDIIQGRDYVVTWTAQLKLTLPVGRTGLRVPLSASYSNRTELEDASNFRGQVGLVYDLDGAIARVR